MSDVKFIRRGHKAAVCLTDDMLVELAGGVGFTLEGDFTGVRRIVIVNEAMYNAIAAEAPGAPDEPTKPS